MLAEVKLSRCPLEVSLQHRLTEGLKNSWKSGHGFPIQFFDQTTDLMRHASMCYTVNSMTEGIVRQSRQISSGTIVRFPQCDKCPLAKKIQEDHPDLDLQAFSY